MAPNKEWFKPLSPTALNKYNALNVVYNKNEKFNPDKPYDLLWQIWLLSPNKNQTNHFGFIRLRKENVTGDKFKLIVEQEVIQFSSLFVISANIDCYNDKYSTPYKWEIHYKLYHNGRNIKDAELIKTEKLDSKRFNKKLTSSWGLLDSIQRLSKLNDKILKFNLLDELDKFKENYIIQFINNKKISFSGKKITTKYYQQIGNAMLPWEYYLDNSNRLVLGISGFKAYILNPEVEKLHKQILRKLKIRG